jgi:hypothetical protein
MREVLRKEEIERQKTIIYWNSYMIRRDFRK